MVKYQFFATDQYYDIVSILYRCSAALSVFGSAWIVAEIISNPKKKATTCYHRLLLGLSSFDLLCSICFFAGTWAQPSISVWTYGSTSRGNGNITTCNISGFFIFLGSLAIPWYNVSISIYYYLAVCHSWRELRMKKSFERYVHAVICSIAMLVAIIPFFMDLYNPYFFYCFVATLPDRGSIAAQFVFQGIYMTSVILCTGVIICMMFRIKCHVTSTTRQSESYEISSYLTKVKKGTTTSTKRQMQSRRSRRKRKQASEVTTMALLYSVPFIVTWFIPVMWFLCLQISWATSFKIISNREVLHVVSEGQSRGIL
mmetsp:Transcript_26848/g.40795  ORF Transcript_26848/g.40795 Transcript_26848/m.40795 type:complete len:314 (-) Transcript_26848:45-986(-)